MQSSKQFVRYIKADNYPHALKTVSLQLSRICEERKLTKMRFQALMAIPAATFSSRHVASAVAVNTTTLYRRACGQYRETCSSRSFISVDEQHAYFTAIGCRDTNSNVMDARIDLNDCIATGSGGLVPGQGYKFRLELIPTSLIRQVSWQVS